MFLLAGVLAYELRFSSTVVGWRPILFSLEFIPYLKVLSLIGLVWIIIFSLNDLYQTSLRQTVIEEINKVFLACSVGFAFVAIVMFFSRELFQSRFIVLSGFVLSLITISIGRLFIRYIQKLFLAKKIGLSNVVILGDSFVACNLEKIFNNGLVLGYRVIERINNLDHLTLARLEILHQNHKINEIILAQNNMSSELSADLSDFTFEHNIVFRYTANLFEVLNKNIEVHILENIPVIELKKTPLEGWFRVVKRIIDVSVAVLGLIILFPFLVIIGIWIKSDSKGPVLYSQMRVGPKGLFKIYKFRSMKTEYCVGDNYGGELADKFYKDLINNPEFNVRNGILSKIINDPRWTRVGKFIRTTSIDELPQLINIILGDMSLVGPRPHLPNEVAQYQKGHKKLLLIKPGMTGLSQVNGRSDVDFEKEVQLDTYYIENWSLLMDFEIILKTFVVIFGKRKTI